MQRQGEERKSGWFPANYVQLVGGEEGAGGEAPGGDGAGECRVEALYDYAAQQEGDLAFDRGAIIVVVEKQDENWWRGRDQSGNEGTFPANYVQPLPQTVMFLVVMLVVEITASPRTVKKNWILGKPNKVWNGRIDEPLGGTAE